MRFADTTFLLDDAPNDAYQFLQGNDDLYGALTEASYGKRVTGKSDYRNDQDIYSTVFAPNSPLAVDMSTVNGSGWRLNFMNETWP